MRLIIALVGAIYATPAAALDVYIDPHLIDRCFPIVDNPMQCVGRQADSCIQENGSGSDMVRAACFEAEAVVWDDFLNIAYRDLVSLALAREQSNSRWASGSLVKPLRDMQIAWINYRDASCANAKLLAELSGSDVSAATSICHMQYTARQYFVLRGIRRDYTPY